jgi:hypothetical protein
MGHFPARAMQNANGVATCLTLVHWFPLTAYGPGVVVPHPLARMVFWYMAPHLGSGPLTPDRTLRGEQMPDWVGAAMWS